MLKRLILPALLGILGTALPTAADPVRITSGLLAGSDDDAIEFLMSGSGLSLTGTTAPVGVFPHFCGVTGNEPPCVPGAARSLSSSYHARAADRQVTVTLNGTTLNTADVTFEFFSSTVVIPTLRLAEEVTLTRPFTFRGTVTALSGDDVAFSRDLFGSGIASLLFRGDERGVNADATRYDFMSTPEPASLLLLGSGLSGIVASRRRVAVPTDRMKAIAS